MKFDAVRHEVISYVNVEFDSKKRVPVHRSCGGRVIIDEKTSELDSKHS